MTACERFGHAWHQIQFKGLVCGRCDISALENEHPELAGSVDRWRAKSMIGGTR